MKYFNFFFEKEELINYIRGRFAGESAAIIYGADESSWSGKTVRVKTYADQKGFVFNVRSADLAKEIKIDWNTAAIERSEDLAKFCLGDDCIEIQAMDRDKFYLHYTCVNDGKKQIVFSGMLKRKKWFSFRG